jgi:hypothetical protein
MVAMATWRPGLEELHLLDWLLYRCMCGVLLANRGANVTAVMVQGDKALLAIVVSLPCIKGVNRLSVLLNGAYCT